MNFVAFPGDPDGLTRFLTCIAHVREDRLLEYTDPFTGARQLASTDPLWIVDVDEVVRAAALQGITVDEAAERMYGALPFGIPIELVTIPEGAA